MERRCLVFTNQSCEVRLTPKVSEARIVSGFCTAGAPIRSTRSRAASSWGPFPAGPGALSCADDYRTARENGPTRRIACTPKSSTATSSHICTDAFEELQTNGELWLSCKSPRFSRYASVLCLTVRQWHITSRAALSRHSRRHGCGH